MAITEQSNFAGRSLTLTWQEAKEIPADKKISQVSAFCLNDASEVLIVKNNHGWGLPGGHPEEGETVETALHREIMEEASCTINDFELFGYVAVSDPDNDSIEGRNYVQLRFICHLDEIQNFQVDYETLERQFVAVDKLPEYVTWMASSVTGRGQYESLKKLLE